MSHIRLEAAAAQLKEAEITKSFCPLESLYLANKPSFLEKELGKSYLNCRVMIMQYRWIERNAMIWVRFEL